ncbi:MAG TPA: glycoside hydrolase family 2 TIM barrel-domain containing protein [Pyrinomonadaceae bacterium]|nr:glycoside hydrolase family 2 TIM barrel-domain containing protein [Pyrinomonadaceae bacterium]
MKDQNPSQPEAQLTRRSFLKSTSSAVVGSALLGALPVERLAAQAAGSASEAESNLLQAVLSADNSAGVSQRLLKGWEYRRGNLGGIWEAWRKASEDNVTWQVVELPHCFNAFDAVDPDTAYYQGPGWYRTHLKIENPYAQGRTLLHFEGAGQKSEVYVYTEKTDAHVGGYDEFTVDITDAAARALKNPDNKGLVPVAVMCDNSRDLEMIPSNLSDFNLYGGLYRYVNLVYVPSISLERVHVETSVDDKSKVATAAIRARLYNPAKLKDEVQIVVEVLDPQGRVVQTSSKNHAPWTDERELATFNINSPVLWSPRSPSLYQCVVTLKSAHGESRVGERFGLRFFEFVEHGPFKLNGERLLLRGTQRHEDHAGRGAAMTEDLIRREMTLIKEMGANFMRLAHYQQSRIVLNMCDELGLLVWEEIPWCRGGLGGERYKEQARRMLRNMIDQHRNHPSVIIWGLGNENDWPGDFEEFDKTKIRAFMSELNDLAHRLDPSRKTAIRRCDFCSDIVDVYSPSIWAGWYRGRYTEYKSSSEEEMKKVKHFLHAEWGGDSHARRHSENPDQVLSRIATGKGTDERGLDFLLTGGIARASRDGDWSETYICNLFDWHLNEQETMDWLTGAAQWIFKDFSTPARPENPVPRVNQKGLIERDLTLKEGYFVFQSYWTEKPMVHIYGHSWPVRWGEKIEQKMVKVYSNCPEVELFLNGRSVGIKKRNSQDFPAAGLRWMLQFKEGENHLKAVGRRDSVEVTDEIKYLYQTKKWEKPARLVLEEVGRSGETVTVEARLLDRNGVLCLDARNSVRFGLTGDGRLLDNLGTSRGARKVELYNGRALISVERKGGVAVVSVSSDGVPTAFLTLEDQKQKTK